VVDEDIAHDFRLPGLPGTEHGDELIGAVHQGTGGQEVAARKGTSSVGESNGQDGRFLITGDSGFQGD
jgi:hypothetical protein